MDFSKLGGLLPAVVQDARTLEVLTLAYMNAEALERTRATGELHSQATTETNPREVRHDANSPEA